MSGITKSVGNFFDKGFQASADIGKGIGSVFGIGGEEAAQEAAQAQAQASLAGVEEERREFDITQETFRPTIEAGDLAREQQLALLGLRGEEAFEQATRLSPAQAFIEKRSQRNLLRNASAIGGVGGGNIRSALVEQGAGFAGTQLQNQFSQLGQVAGQGTASVANQGQLAGQSSQNIANLLQAGGQAQASGILGAQQTQQQGASNALTALGFLL